MDHLPEKWLMEFDENEQVRLIMSSILAIPNTKYDRLKFNAIPPICPYSVLPCRL